MKKVLSILLALIIALSAFSMAAFAADAPKTKTEALLDKLYTRNRASGIIHPRQEVRIRPAHVGNDRIRQGQ